MTMAMARVSMLLACLACGSYARRVHVSGRAQSEGRSDASKELAAFLQALSPQAAFKPRFEGSSMRSLQRPRSHDMVRTMAPSMDAVASTINSNTDDKPARPDLRSSLRKETKAKKKQWVNTNSTDYKVDEGLEQMVQEVLDQKDKHPGVLKGLHGAFKEQPEMSTEEWAYHASKEVIKPVHEDPMESEKLKEAFENYNEKVASEKAFWEELEQLEKEKVKARQEAEMRKRKEEDAQKQLSLSSKIFTQDRLAEFILFFLGLEGCASGATEALKIAISPTGGDPIDVASGFAFGAVGLYFWRRRLGINNEKREAEKLAAMEELSKWD